MQTLFVLGSSKDKIYTFTWVGFFRDKSKTFDVFQVLYLQLLIEKEQKFDGVGKIRSDHGTKFDQVYFKKKKFLKEELNMSFQHQRHHNRMV